MMNSSKLKAGQDSESQKSYESVLILKVQNEKRFWIQHYYTEFFFTYFSWVYGLVCGTARMNSECLC